ncbi:hypothetical protein BJD99_02965 [Rhodococcus sp. 1163]|uniref:universal stress protein n=1 Tax=unclassified Rhodococcus (in: high G+C Gram-positive bacteria) TaxID=192944 RepID=UPI000A096C69|nr:MULTISPECIES: universal stress protein [unclassified Rhodococcus (in: high G+C Gram-positive bacteria)]ORI20443.1 hypothetical protein BJD99_02965 [Rhodococcus sp. 1163]
MNATNKPPSTTVWTNTVLTEIVVGVDGSESSRGALAWAAGLAHDVKARIRIVYALPQRESANRVTRELRASKPRLLGKRLLRSSRNEVHRIDPDIAVDTVLTDDPIASFLGALSHTADLIVIGGNPSSPVRDVVFGHHATRIVADARCPVVVWRPHAVAPAVTSQPVVVGVDNSDSSHGAILGAFWFADTLKAPLMALHMVSSGSHRPATTVDADVQEPKEGSLAWLGSRVTATSERHPSVELHLHCLEASADHELRRASETARLVVVGSRGLGPVAGSIRGSVGQSLVHSSHCPILVVR